MNDRPTVNYLDYLMKDKLIYWLSVFVSQTMKITWITEDVRGGESAYKLNNFLSFTTNLLT